MRKKVILLGVVSVFGLFVLGISLLFQDKPDTKQVSEQFVTEFINKNDAKAAYELVSENFKKYTNLERLQSKIESLSKNVPKDTAVVFVEAIDQPEEEGFLPSTISYYTFQALNKEWVFTITTVEYEKGIFVDSYNIEEKISESN